MECGIGRDEERRNSGLERRGERRNMGFICPPAPRRGKGERRSMGLEEERREEVMGFERVGVHGIESGGEKRLGVSDWKGKGVG